MAAGITPLVHHLRKLLAPPVPVGDAVLLQRFGEGRDEDAFAALVARHGPMVLRVCHRILADRASAEDCFQATFLVLARKAHALRRPELLAGWLHGVALRIASKARKAGYRYKLCQMPANASELPDPRPDPLEQLTVRELLVAVDEEVQRLPEVYRIPVILCCLEDLSQDEAARRLGWTAGSVKARLERGRKRLGTRLAKRGLTLSSALMALAVSESAGSAAVGRGLQTATAKAAAKFATGLAQSSGAAVILAEAALKSMAVGKLKVLALMVVVFALLGIAGAGKLAWDGTGEKPANVSGQTKPIGDAKAAQAAPALNPGPRLDRVGDPLPPGALARLGPTRFRSGDMLDAMALSPDGKTAISVGFEGTQFWNMSTGKAIWRIDTKQGGGGHHVAYSPNGRLAASVQDDGTLHLLDVQTGKELAGLRLKVTGAESLTFAPDGLTVAVGGHSFGKGKDKSVVSLLRWNETTLKSLWEATPIENKLDVKRVSRPHSIRSLAFSPDGKHLATGNLANGTVRIWDVDKGREIRQVKGSGTLIGALAFAPSGHVLASGSETGAVELWEVATGMKKWRSKQPGEVQAVAFAPDNRTLLVGGGRGYWRADVKQHDPFLVVLDSSNGREISRIRTDSNTVSSVAFSKDGAVFAAGLGGTFRVWNGMGRERSRLSGHENGIASVSVSEDGKMTATGGTDGVIILWDLTKGAEIRRLTGHTNWLRAVGFVPGGKLLASASSDQTVRFWELATGKEIQRFQRSPDGNLHAIAISPDGRMLATGDNFDDVIDVWDVATGQRLITLKLSDEERRGTMCLAFSPDGKTLAGGERILRFDEVGLTSRVLIWDAKTGKKLREFPAHQFSVVSFSFSGDGNVLASTGDSDKTIALWEIDSGKKLLDLPCGSGQGQVVFSPDGKTLAWGSPAGEIWLWEMASKKLRRKFSGHSSFVHSLAFSPDGRALVSGSRDTTALVWDITGLKSIPITPGPISKERLENLWSNLASADAVQAGQAIWALTADAKHSVPFIVERLRELPRGDPQRIPKLVADLDSATFTVREAAEKKLDELGKLAEPSLRQALTRQPSLEARLRIEKLLAKRESAIQSPDVLRILRALEALEHTGTTEARQALENLANQVPEPYFQQEARMAAERMLKR